MKQASSRVFPFSMSAAADLSIQPKHNVFAMYSTSVCELTEGRSTRFKVTGHVA